MPELAAHPVLPRRGLVSVRPVHRSNPGEHPLKPCDHRIALSHRRPITAVDVEAQDARDLAPYSIDVRIAVHSASDTIRGGLRQAHPDWLPRLVGQERQVKVACGRAAVSRRMVPGADEFRTLFQRITADRFELEGRGCVSAAL
ncbi:MAG TPA: hypothetical protein VIO80_12820 [Candidatus Dormibacteraeota bacterium]